MPSMQTTDVSADRLQRLAAFEAPGGGRVLSLYLNLDPRSDLARPDARATAVNSLLDEAGRVVEGREGLDHDTRMALRADTDRARTELGDNLDGGWAEGAHALALFVCGPADLFEVVRLAHPTPNHVAVEAWPSIARLAEAGPLDPWAIAVFDGDDFRLLGGHGERLEVIETASDDHEGRTSAGSQSGRRFERPVGLEVDHFLRDVSARIEAADRRHRFAHIVLGATEQHAKVVEERLEAHVLAKLAGRIDAGADWEAVADIRDKVEPLLVAHETRREGEALDRMRTSGVRGLTDTLPALYERRVDTLLLEPGLTHRGVVCPQCRWASADERGTCPVDSTAMVPHPNLTEWAVARAIEGDATILPLRRHNDLEDADGIGAALRF
jgi:hypothetical protein